jgi:hypothetical protein
MINGVRCNGKHLRIHCPKFNNISEDATVGLVFEYDPRLDGPEDFQDGTSAWEFDTEDAPAAAVPPLDTKFDPFVPAVDPPPVVAAVPPVVAAVPQPEATWSVDTVINLLALLLVMGLGCSLLVPVGERESEDDDVFYVGGHAGETASGGLRSMALMCLLSFTSAVQSVVAGDVLTEACAAVATIAATAVAAAAVAVQWLCRRTPWRRRKRHGVRRHSSRSTMFSRHAGYVALAGQPVSFVAESTGSRSELRCCSS